MGQFAQQQQMFFDPTSGQMISADVANQWAGNAVRDCPSGLAYSALLTSAPLLYLTIAQNMNYQGQNYSGAN